MFFWKIKKRKKTFDKYISSMKNQIIFLNETEYIYVLDVYSVNVFCSKKILNDQNFLSIFSFSF